MERWIMRAQSVHISCAPVKGGQRINDISVSAAALVVVGGIFLSHLYNGENF